MAWQDKKRKKKELPIMEPGFAVCPKCNGRGFMRYKVWRSAGVIMGLLRIKDGNDLGMAHVLIIRITCPGCDGSGIIDWVMRANRGETLIRPFIKPEGNMDIYLRALQLWLLNSPTHYCRETEITFSAKKVEKISELSRVRYTGIRLTSRLATLSHDEVFDLFQSLTLYEGFLSFLSKENLTEEELKAELTRRGLAEFMPDKFAYPGPDDLPS